VGDGRLDLLAAHLRVLLDPLFRWVGAGYSTGMFWEWPQGRDTIWTVHFGRR
jgi:hypothetical protein